MNRAATVFAAAVLAIPAAGALRPAEASVRWVVGTDFSVGGIHFSLGFSGPRHYSGYHQPRYYYRTRQNLAYRGYQCGSACYVRDRYTYHGRSCAVVGHHFRRHGFDRGYAWSHVYPGYRGHYGRSYGPPVRDYRHDRYDRHRTYRRHDRWDHRHRYDNRRHRHHRGCRH